VAFSRANTGAHGLPLLGFADWNDTINLSAGAESVLVAIVGALRGAGDTHFTMFASVAAHWMFVPLLYLSLNVFHFSVSTSWLFLVINFLLFCCVLIWRFHSGKWKQIQVIGN